MIGRLHFAREGPASGSSMVRGQATEAEAPFCTPFDWPCRCSGLKRLMPGDIHHDPGKPGVVAMTRVSVA